MPKTPPCRIEGIIAAKANVAVVFRRGPTRHCQLLLWDLDTDVVTPGQWLKGRVYAKRCDLSPDGRHLVIAATNYSRPPIKVDFEWQTDVDQEDELLRYRRARESALQAVGMTQEKLLSMGWTAVCRPPYFSAVALWLTGSAWNGGGIWRDDDLLYVNPDPGNWHERIPLPKGVESLPLGLGRSEDEWMFSLRLASRGWNDLHREVAAAPLPAKPEPLTLKQKRRLKATKEALPKWSAIEQARNEWIQALFDLLPSFRQAPPYRMEKPFAGGFLRREMGTQRERWSAHDRSGVERIAWKEQPWQSQWLDVDHRGRVIFADAGCLWGWPNFPKGEKILVADLNPNTFEPVPPPDWALRW